MSEIEAFPRAVLSHHYPETPLHGDFTTIRAGEYDPIDVLVGGTPCQSFSVAGLRGGMADARGNLALEYLRLAERLRPRWIIWENVPGVLSSGGGRDFGAFLGGLVEFGYGFAYRVLDAQYFGLAQRRKRVFVVGCFGDWRRAAAVLFEPASLRGHPAPGRETRERVAGSLAARTRSGGGLGTDFDCDGGLIATDIYNMTLGDLAHTMRSSGENSVPHIVSMALNAHGGSGRMDGESETFVCETADSLTVGANQTYGFSGDIMAHSLRADGFDASEDGMGRGAPLVAFDYSMIGSPNDGTSLSPGHASPSLTKHNSDKVALGTSAVRRLTPRECERLQGFPDDYTLIPWRNGMASDGPRYRALGNSMAVPVMYWLGRRIQHVISSDLREVA